MQNDNSLKRVENMLDQTDRGLVNMLTSHFMTTRDSASRAMLHATYAMCQAPSFQDLINNSLTQTRKKFRFSTHNSFNRE